MPSMGLFMALAEALEECASQEGNIFAPFAQRRQMNGDDAETIKKIFAKFARGNGLFQVAVGGGDHAHVHVRSLRCSPSGRILPSCRTR